MTTIAYRDGIVASDSGISGNGTRHGSFKKLVKNDAGDIAGGAGEVMPVFAFLRWFLEGMPKKIPESASQSDGWSGFILRTASPELVEIFEQKGSYKYTPDFFAMGSGEDIAYGAMEAGATATEAVRIATKLDMASFGEIVTLELGKGK